MVLLYTVSPGKSSIVYNFSEEKKESCLACGGSPANAESGKRVMAKKKEKNKYKVLMTSSLSFLNLWKNVMKCDELL